MNTVGLALIDLTLDQLESAAFQAARLAVFAANAVEAHLDTLDTLDEASQAQRGVIREQISRIRRTFGAVAAIAHHRADYEIEPAPESATKE